MCCMLTWAPVELVPEKYSVLLAPRVAELLVVALVFILRSRASLVLLEGPYNGKRAATMNHEPILMRALTKK